MVYNFQIHESTVETFLDQKVDGAEWNPTTGHTISL